MLIQLNVVLVPLIDMLKFLKLLFSYYLYMMYYKTNHVAESDRSSPALSNSPVPESNDGENNKNNRADNSVTTRQSGNTRKRVNYNIQQIQAEQFLMKPADNNNDEEDNNLNGPDNIQSISPVELKKANKRFEELSRENYNDLAKFEIPRNITGLNIVKDTKPSSAVKRILVSRKNWSNYVDEIDKKELKLIQNGGKLEVLPNVFKIKKLCTICGGISYSSCIKCHARVCSVKCQNVHNETRCTFF